MTSKPSLSFSVIIFTSASFSIEKLKSSRFTSTFITQACLARDLLNFSANSKPFTDLLNEDSKLPLVLGRTFSLNLKIGFFPAVFASINAFSAAF